MKTSTSRELKHHSSTKHITTTPKTLTEQGGTNQITGAQTSSGGDPQPITQKPVQVSNEFGTQVMDITEGDPQDWSHDWIYQGHGHWTRGQEDYPSQMKEHQQIPHMTSLDRMATEITNQDLWLHKQVWDKGYPNRYGARIPIKPIWNLELLEELLQDYEDKEILEWLKYGWPSGRLPTLPEPEKTFKNHKGATDHPLALRKYIKKELLSGAVIGPFQQISFQHRVGISPISTRPKKDTMERRVIIDLSFPIGSAINDGMIKDNYLGIHTKLTFPRTDDLAIRIFQLGRGAVMFKIDLRRYFCQLPLDPGDYSLIGYIIDGEVYFDKVLPMGLRSAPYVAQRVTNAIRYIHEQMGYFLLNYVDDFLGAEFREVAEAAFQFLQELLQRLQVEVSPEKVVPPTTRIEFLGITFDSQTMSIELPEDKITDIKAELRGWLYKTYATRKEVEQLAGKLQFASKCIRAGRVFISHILGWLRTMKRGSKYTIPLEARKDLAWWARFMEIYNGYSIMWMNANPKTDAIVASDACLNGYGGTYGNQYIRGRFPTQMQGNNIAQLEIRALIACLKTWKEHLRGKYFWVHVDNEAVATVINTGAARDLILQDALREIAFLVAQYDFMIKARHILDILNRVPDWLSRWDEPEARRRFRSYAENSSLKHVRTSHRAVEFNHSW